MLFSSALIKSVQKAVRDVSQEARNPAGAKGGGEWTVKQPWQMTKAEFTGTPRLYSGKINAKELPKKVFPATTAAQAEPFMEGKYTIKKGPSQYAVYDGVKPIATYSSGDNLVVDPKYRRQGIGTEIVKAFKNERNASPSAAARTHEANALYLKAHKDIVTEAVKQGKPVPPEVLADYPELKAVAAAKTVAKPAGKPITHAFKISGTGPTADKVRDAIKAITRVHGDGTLPTIPLNIAASKRSVSGQFFHSTDGSPLEISIKETAGDPLAHTRMTAAHEIGHFLDHSGLQSKGYASEANNPVVQDVMKTIEGTARVTTLRDMAKKGYAIITYGNGKRVKEKLPKAYLNYRLEPVELFADAYAHYITFRSGNKAMSEEHKERQSMQGMSHYPDVWDKEDFEQTAQAFDAMFQKMGWRA